MDVEISTTGNIKTATELAYTEVISYNKKNFFSHSDEERGNVNLRCLWQRAVLPIIVVSTKRKEVTPNAQRKY